MVGFILLRFKEKRGHWPLLKSRGAATSNAADPEATSSDDEVIRVEQKEAKTGVQSVDP